MKPNRIIVLLLLCALSFGGVALGRAKPEQPPRHNPGELKHPNLAAAQRDLQNAYAKIADAEQANEFDSPGQAQKVKDLIDQATQEIGRAESKMDAAEKGSEFDLGGHAQKAKQLIDQANQELKLAIQGAKH